MLQCLHINNWFDISQSLLLPAIGLIFQERWNNFLLLVFSDFIICFFSSYRIILITLHFQQAYHTLYFCVYVFVCTYLCVSILPWIYSQNHSLYICTSSCIISFNVSFGALYPFINFCLCIPVLMQSIFVISQYIVLKCPWALISYSFSLLFSLININPTLLKWNWDPKFIWATGHYTGKYFLLVH